MARCPRPSCRPDASPRSTSWSRPGGPPGSTPSASTAGRRRSPRPAGTSSDRKAAGLARRHAVHLPRPERSDRSRDRPARRPGPGGRAPAATGGLRRRTAGGRRPAARWPRGPLRLGRPLRRRCGPALAAVARAAQGRRAGGPGSLADDNALVDREAAYRAGLGWYGKNANLLLPGRGQLVRARLGGHRRAAGRRGRAAPVRRRLRRLHPLPRRLPDRAPSSPPAWSTPAAAWPGCCRRGRRSPVEYREALGDRHLRLRRLPGGVPAEPARRPVGGATARRPTPAREAGVDVLDLLAATDDELLARHGRWYIPGREPRYLRRNALVVLGNVGDRRRPARWSAALRRLRWPTTTRCCGRTPCGRPAASAATTSCRGWRRPTTPTRWCAPSSTRRRRRRRARTRARDAPARHQRLPAQGRRHPVLPVGAVAPARPRTTFTVLTTPYEGADAWDAEQPFRVVRTPRAGAAARPRRWPGGSTRLAAEVGADAGRARPGPAARPASGPRLRAPYGVVLHGAEVTVPGPPARAAGPLLGRVLRGAAEVIAAGGYPAAEGERAAGRPLPVDGRAARASTPTASGPLDDEARAKAPGPVRPARRRPRSWSASAGSCPARAWTS